MNVTDIRDDFESCKKTQNIYEFDESNLYDFTFEKFQ